MLTTEHIEDPRLLLSSKESLSRQKLTNHQFLSLWCIRCQFRRAKSCHSTSMVPNFEKDAKIGPMLSGLTKEFEKRFCYPARLSSISFWNSSVSSNLQGMAQKFYAFTMYICISCVLSIAMLGQIIRGTGTDMADSTQHNRVQKTYDPT